jgi:type IV secretory pathway ATPase VirB11/archaellum biosynthesis ATPase
MLSLVDLIEAGTLDLPLAAYLAAAMRAGASLMVGARPGGAGKTVVMCALLNFLPDDTVIRACGQPGGLGRRSAG